MSVEDWIEGRDEDEYFDSEEGASDEDICVSWRQFMDIVNSFDDSKKREKTNE